MKRCYPITLLAIVFKLLVSGTAVSQSFNIGLSNGWVGSEWRTQMIHEAYAQVAGKPSHYSVSSSLSLGAAAQFFK